MTVHRCPRCARPRVAGFRYCPACAFDYDTIDGEDMPRAADETPPHVVYRDRPTYDSRGYGADPDSMRRDIARYSLVRWQLGCQSRAAGCLGAIVGFVLGAAMAGLTAPTGTSANPLVTLFLAFGGAILGMWVAAVWFVRRAAR